MEICSFHEKCDGKEENKRYFTNIKEKYVFYKYIYILIHS